MSSKPPSPPSLEAVVQAGLAELGPSRPTTTAAQAAGVACAPRPPRPPLRPSFPLSGSTLPFSVLLPLSLPLGTGSQSNVADLFSGSTKFTAEFFFILGFHHNDYSQNIRVSQATWMAGKSLTCTWVCPSCVRSCTASPAEAAGERDGDTGDAPHGTRDAGSLALSHTQRGPEDQRAHEPAHPEHSPGTCRALSLHPQKIVEDLLCFDLLIEFDHETSFLYLIQKVVGHAVNMYYSLIHIYKHKHNYGVNGKGYSFLARGLPYTILKNVLLKVEIISCCKKQFPNLSS